MKSVHAAGRSMIAAATARRRRPWRTHARSVDGAAGDHPTQNARRVGAFELRVADGGTGCEGTCSPALRRRPHTHPSTFGARLVNRFESEPDSAARRNGTRSGVRRSQPLTVQPVRILAALHVLLRVAAVTPERVESISRASNFREAPAPRRAAPRAS